MSKPWETVLITEIEGFPSKLPLLHLRGLNGTQVVSYGTEGEFDFEFPATGCFNYKNTGYAYFRRPSRQNKRALCGNTSVRFNYYTQNRLTLQCTMDLFVADALFKPRFPSKGEAVESLNNGTAYCLATSPEFILGLNPTSCPNHLLFHRLTPIAEISPEGAVSKVLHPFFESKVNDYIG